MIHAEVLDTKQTLRLIRDLDRGLCAVIEGRGGRATSPHEAHRRDDAPTAPEGVAEVLGQRPSASAEASGSD